MLDRVTVRMAIQEHEGTLSAADRRLIAELLDNPTEAAFLSAADLAARGGVHQAAATRLAKKLGYRGYPHLRAELQAELRDSIGPGERVRRRLAHAAGESLLARMVEDEVAALTDLPSQVDQAQLDNAAQLISGAKRVFLFGHGHATALVDLLGRRLRRSGHAVLPLVGPPRDLAEQSALLSPTDLLVGFLFHRQPPGLQPLLRRAAEVGAPSLLIADAVGAVVRPQPTVLLAARRGSETEFQSLTVPMAICNALVLTLARLDTGSMSALDNLTDLIDQFESERGRSR
jgi:DNA-binding MurR/RpiR family transcriptional regulator